jgi:hypothetical protein
VVSFLAKRPSLFVQGGWGSIGLCRGPLSGEAWRGSGGVRAGGRSPAWVAPVRSRLDETTPARRAYGVGTAVGVRAYHCGSWSLNPARLVYLVEETADVKRFGFGYGTLPGHVERGEERFSRGVEPREWLRLLRRLRLLPSKTSPGLARLYPFACALQRRFARDSKRVMLVAAGV